MQNWVRTLGSLSAAETGVFHHYVQQPVRNLPILLVVVSRENEFSLFHATLRLLVGVLAVAFPCTPTRYFSSTAQLVPESVVVGKETRA